MKKKHPLRLSRVLFFALMLHNRIRYPYTKLVTIIRDDLYARP